MRKLTYEEVRDYINGPDGNGCVLLSTEYVNSKSNLEIRCACGNIFWKPWNRFYTHKQKQCPICGVVLRNSSLAFAPLEKSLGYLYPELLKQWDYDNNKDIDPFTVYSKSSKIVWWKDEFGNSWRQAVSNRTSNGCGYVGYTRKISHIEQKLYNEFSKFFNVESSYKDFGYELDLYFHEYSLAIEYDGYYWHKDKYYNDLEKNKKCFVAGVSLVRLRGKTGNKYLRKVTKYDYNTNFESYSRFTIKHMVDICTHLYNATNISKFLEMVKFYKTGKWASDKLIGSHIKLEDSIYHKHPDIMRDWDWEKNKEHNPKMLISGSGRKVWWKCNKCGYEWQAGVYGRAVRGQGCKQCFYDSRRKKPKT